MSGRVLVVEDSELGGRTLLTILGAAGYDARLETTAADGLAAAAEWDPSTVILDRHLPDGDGAKLASKFGTPDRRVFLLSGDARPSGVRGIAGWLLKPVSARDLLAVIADAN